ncbi:MAG TPA: hypothetical protein VLZ55_01580 [Rhodanobacter sp.]|nr:hypothetical protein [Rhodanobacter sp.]
MPKVNQLSFAISHLDHCIPGVVATQTVGILTQATTRNCITAHKTTHHVRNANMRLARIHDAMLQQPDTPEPNRASDVEPNPVTTTGVFRMPSCHCPQSEHPKRERQSRPSAGGVRR